MLNQVDADDEDNGQSETGDGRLSSCLRTFWRDGGTERRQITRELPDAGTVLVFLEMVEHWKDAATSASLAQWRSSATGTGNLASCLRPCDLQQRCPRFYNIVQCFEMGFLSFGSSWLFNNATAASRKEEAQDERTERKDEKRKTPRNETCY